MLHASLEKKLIKKIKRYQNQGFNNYQIRLSLIRQHYPAHVINDLVEKASKESHHHQINKDLVFAVIGCILIIPLLAFFTYNIFKTEYVICESNDCLIEAANQCEDAIFTQNVQGVYTAEMKTTNCKFVKEMRLVEDDMLGKTLEGKSMECKFKKDQFNELLVTTLTHNLENCKGLLKDELEILRETLVEETI